MFQACFNIFLEDILKNVGNQTIAPHLKVGKILWKSQDQQLFGFSLTSHTFCLLKNTNM